MSQYGGTNGGNSTPGADDTPYIHFAIDQLTRDEEMMGASRIGSAISVDYPVERVVPDEGLGYYGQAKKSLESQRLRQERRPSTARADSPGPEIFTAIDPPEDDYRYPRLEFIPFVLRPISLAATILLCLMMMAALIFCNVWSERHSGLWDYDGLGGSRYFVFQFLPQLLAISFVIWLFVIQAAVYRIIPHCIMASERHLNRVLLRLPILSCNFLIPDFSHFRHGEWLVGVALFLIWLGNFMAVPLQSGLFTTRWYEIDGVGAWRWVSVQPIVWVLVALYALVVVALLLLLFRFGHSWSGLMWDPVSLADMIPLIQRSNILHDFGRSETATAVSEVVPPKVLRLGYWRTSGTSSPFYGISEEYAPLRTSSLYHDTRGKKEPWNPDNFDLEQQRLTTSESFQRRLHSPFVRYRWTPWFLRDTFVIAWIATVVVLVVAFLVVSFVHNAIQGGFMPKLPTLTSNGGFSSSNFLYSFIPAIVGNMLFLAWQSIDVYFRALQPFADMASPEGTSAEKSLLLAYPSCMPFEVTILALFAGHFKVAWISFMSVASLALPVLAGGIFMALFYPADGNVRMAAYMPAYNALIAFVVLYALSFAFLWPRRKRYLPHSMTTLADVISFFYQSPMLSDKVLREPRSKADLVTRLVVAPPGEIERPKYAFGVYIGRDGTEHLGIDRLQRPGRAEMLITTGTMK